MDTTRNEETPLLTESAKPTGENSVSYPETTENDLIAKGARQAVNQMSEEEVEKEMLEAMARIYGGRSAQQATVA